MTKPTRAIRGVSGLVLLTLALLVAAGCGGSSKKSAQPTTTGSSLPRSSNPTSTSPVPTPRSGPGPSASSRPLRAGALVVQTVAATTNLYQVLGGSLTSYAPGQVQGKGVRIVSVVGPEVFWIGKGPGKRVLVQIRLKGGKPPARLRAEKKVQLVGQLTKNPANAADQFGVKDSASKALLERQGAYVEVSIGDLKIS